MQKLRVLHEKHDVLGTKTQEFCTQYISYCTLKPKLLHSNSLFLHLQKVSL